MDLNKWIAVGKVGGAPQVSEKDGKKQAFFYFIVNRRAQDGNGQWVDVAMKVPVFASENKADLIEKYVVDGQELGLECYYMSWENGHGMVVQNVSFGFKPKRDAPAGGGQANMGPPGL